MGSGPSSNSGVSSALERKCPKEPFRAFKRLLRSSWVGVGGRWGGLGWGPDPLPQQPSHTLFFVSLSHCTLFFARPFLVSSSHYLNQPIDTTVGLTRSDCRHSLSRESSHITTIQPGNQSRRWTQRSAGVRARRDIHIYTHMGCKCSLYAQYTHDCG